MAENETSTDLESRLAVIREMATNGRDVPATLVLTLLEEIVMRLGEQKGAILDVRSALDTRLPVTPAPGVVRILRDRTGLGEAEVQALWAQLRDATAGE